MPTYRRVLASGCLLALLLWASDRPACGARQWRVIPIGSAGNLHVQLEVLMSPSLADAEWIRWVFVNKDKAPVALRTVGYRVEGTRYDPTTNKNMGGGGMGQGNEFDLFPHILEQDRRKGCVVEPGVYRQARHPSRYVAACIGLPPKQGYRVLARAHFNLTTKDGRRIRTPALGVPFAFSWSYPTAAGLKTMRTRLKRLLENPEDSMQACHSYLLGTLLRVEEVRRTVSFDQMTKALSIRGSSPDGRVVLAEWLHKAGYDREALVAWFRFRMHAEDKRVLDDLKHAPQSFWDASFLPPLVAMHEKEGGIEVVAFLWRHHRHWGNDRGASKRIFAATMKTHGSLLRMSGREVLAARRAEHFLRAVHELALGRSREALRVLSAHLDDKTMLIPAGEVLVGRLLYEPPLAHRMCDIALEGILVVLHGRALKGYRAVLSEKAAETIARSGKGDSAEIIAIRDEAIRRVKASLKQR